MFQELPEYDTEKYKVNKCLWKNGAIELLDAGLPPTFKMRYLQSTIKQCAIKWCMPVLNMFTIILSLPKEVIGNIFLLAISSSSLIFWKHLDLKFKESMIKYIFLHI